MATSLGVLARTNRLLLVTQKSLMVLILHEVSDFITPLNGMVFGLLSLLGCATAPVRSHLLVFDISSAPDTGARLSSRSARTVRYSKLVPCHHILHSSLPVLTSLLYSSSTSRPAITSGGLSDKKGPCSQRTQACRLLAASQWQHSFLTPYLACGLARAVARSSHSGACRPLEGPLGCCHNSSVSTLGSGFLQ